MCVNGQRGGAVGNGVCRLWESCQLFHRAVNICFPSAERPFSTFPFYLCTQPLNFCQQIFFYLLRQLLWRTTLTAAATPFDG